MVLLLTGCISTGQRSRPSDDAPAQPTSSASDPSFAEQPPEDPNVGAGNLAFGDAYTYTDDVSISVSLPAPFTPGEYAFGADQAANLLFSITITNDSGENLDPLTYSEVSSGGAESTAIFDPGNAAGNIGTPPQTVILPGGTITWLEAYSVADPASVVFQIRPAFDYNPVIFTNAQ